MCADTHAHTHTTEPDKRQAAAAWERESLKNRVSAHRGPQALVVWLAGISLGAAARAWVGAWWTGTAQTGKQAACDDDDVRLLPPAGQLQTPRVCFLTKPRLALPCLPHTLLCEM